MDVHYSDIIGLIADQIENYVVFRSLFPRPLSQEKGQLVGGIVTKTSNAPTNIEIDWQVPDVEKKHVCS